MEKKYKPTLVLLISCFIIGFITPILTKISGKYFGNELFGFLIALFLAVITGLILRFVYFSKPEIKEFNKMDELEKISLYKAGYNAFFVLFITNVSFGALYHYTSFFKNISYDIFYLIFLILGTFFYLGGLFYYRKHPEKI